MTTVILIHGGSTTARYWDLLREQLQTESVAVDLPGRSQRPADLATVTLPDAVESVASDVRGVADDVILVAHSSGGLVIPGVVSKLGEKVRHVVLNAASVPPEAGMGLECMQFRHRDSVRSIGKLIESGQAITTPTQPPERDRLRRTYGGRELSDEEIDFLQDPVRFVPDTYNYYFSPVYWSQAGRVPHTYILNLYDRAVPLELQEEMVRRLPFPPGIVPLATGHMPAVTMPAVLAALLDGIATYPALSTTASPQAG
jgi:pimeloyl-ACP methyl ester carboxylesterase